MVILSEKTKMIVNFIFPGEDQNEVVELLEFECSDNLPFLEKSNSETLERLRFAVLKISKGRISKLYDAIQLAETDWRDLLVAADFGDDVYAHDYWAKELLGK